MTLRDEVSLNNNSGSQKWGLTEDLVAHRDEILLTI